MQIFLGVFLRSKKQTFFCSLLLFGHFNKFTRITYKWMYAAKHQAVHFITMHTYEYVYSGVVCNQKTKPKLI